MRRRSDSYDEEEARREPLLGRQESNSQGGAAAAAAAGAASDDDDDGLRPLGERQGLAVHQGGEEGQDRLSRGPSRGLSPDRPLREASTPGGAIRLTKRASTLAQEDEEARQGLVLKDAPEEGSKDGDVRELEIEVVAGAVAEAVAEAVQEAVQEAVHDAVQQAIEDHVTFDVVGNINTLVAVTGVILFWRGVWNTWDLLFGTDSLWSTGGSLVVGLLIMVLIRFFNLPLVEGLPGG